MGTVEAQLGLKIEYSRAQLGHSRGIKLLGHSWAQLGHNFRTDERKVSVGTVGAELTHIWGTHFSWGRVKMKLSLEVSN